MTSSTCVAYRRDILAGSRPGRRGTLVSAKVPKASCACASARKSQRVPCAPHRFRGPGKGLSSLPLALLRSKARGSPSVASPFDGMTVHWTLICFRLTPVPGPDARFPSRARSGPTSLSSLHCPVSLERPGFAVRGEPARRGGDSLDPRLLSDSPLGAWLGERRPKNTNSKHRSSAALLTRLE